VHSSIFHYSAKKKEKKRKEKKRRRRYICAGFEVLTSVATKITCGMLHRRQQYFLKWNIVSEYMPTLMARAALSQRAYGWAKESNKEFGTDSQPPEHNAAPLKTEWWLRLSVQEETHCL
jgi:hypothetical protein